MRSAFSWNPDTSALILVDVQNDFLPGGALAVPEGDAVIPVVNRVQARFDRIVATQDWHPADHGSFAANHPGCEPGAVVKLGGMDQVLWPVHCVQGTAGAVLAAGLDVSRVGDVVRKGTDPGIDSYSGFFDNGRRKATGLDDRLRSDGVTTLFVAGLATDYCVKFTALDARSLGYRTVLITDGCRGVGLRAGDVEAAIEDMKRAGVELTTSDAVVGTS